MPIIAEIGRKTLKGRATMFVIYAALGVLGATMVFPFLITVSSSISNDFDYDRFSPLPRYLWSSTDRFTKGLTQYFNGYPDWQRQMRAYFRDMPAQWNSWREIGRDTRDVDRFAQAYLRASPEERRRWKVLAGDYAEFVRKYPISDTMCAVSDLESTRFLFAHYEKLWAQQHAEQAARASASERRREGLKLLAATWGRPLPNLQTITFAGSEMGLPVWQQSWFPPNDPKYTDFERVKEMYRSQGDPAPLATPFAMRAVWRKYLESEEARTLAGLAGSQQFDVAAYNRLAGTHYPSLFDTPFPVPADNAEAIQRIWKQFVETRYPLRLTTLRVTPELSQRYRGFLRERFKTVEYANRILGASKQSWDEFELSADAPRGVENQNLRSVWSDFAMTLPAADRILHSSEHAYQAFLLSKYGSLEKMNAACGWKLQRIEDAFPPFDVAYALTYQHNERAFLFGPLFRNYALVADFLGGRGNAVLVTLFLIILNILATLTINPLAAYGLSRFNIRGKDKLILYLLATMAFPAMVSAIPAYLLMRDLGLLNTFLALVLPSAANGMTIFILKGFFDSLPSELYDAATIDGANEWQIFTRVTMPMMKPILAINALGAFLVAYNGWEWALIICQKQSMWTIAVWLYQANQWWAGTPWIATAGFVVVSIPTLLVFLFCQKIILRGIILPSMK